jgi:putative ABC transport system permease protein
MSEVIRLSPFDLGCAALLILALGGLSLRLRLGLEKRLLISAVRTVVQLSLVGVVLKALFAHVHLGWMSLTALAMLLAAGYEAGSRQKYPLRGGWGLGIGTGAMFLSAFTVTWFALRVMIAADPWYAPRYAIPLLGMLLGNTMNGIALSVNHLTQNLRAQRAAVETRLALGQTASEAVADLRRESLRTGLIPIINAMAAAGIVSLPGMMTGQILAGNAPADAVNYQILIMFLIGAGTGFGAVAAVWMTSRRLFDERHRLRLDRLTVRGRAG